MKNLKIFIILYVILIPNFSFTVTLKDCHEQFDLDTITCQELSESSASSERKNFCWRQIHERFSYCKRNLEIGWPSLYLKILFNMPLTK